MNDQTIQREASAIVATLPARIHEIIEPFVASHPDAPALACGDVQWTYGELARRLADTAHALAAQGVRAGDRVLVVSENGLSLAALVLACSRIDAWTVIVNPRLAARELDQIRDHCGARRVCFAVKGGPEAGEHARRYGAVAMTLGPLEDLAVAPLNDSAQPEPTHASGASQVAALLYTSGTDLLDYAAPLLTAYKRPTEIVLLAALPASSTGKILKHQLVGAARQAQAGPTT
ncbi:MAG: AMP-binding protein [Burkholderiaceae bacterium]|nr:AMP-binding protein [Burkholderiaceae bacterium]